MYCLHLIKETCLSLHFPIISIWHTSHLHFQSFGTVSNYYSVKLEHWLIFWRAPYPRSPSASSDHNSRVRKPAGALHAQCSAPFHPERTFNLNIESHHFSIQLLFNLSLSQQAAAGGSIPLWIMRAQGCGLTFSDTLYPLMLIWRDSAHT